MILGEIYRDVKGQVGGLRKLRVVRERASDRQIKDRFEAEGDLAYLLDLVQMDGLFIVCRMGGKIVFQAAALELDTMGMMAHAVLGRPASSPPIYRIKGDVVAWGLP